MPCPLLTYCENLFNDVPDECFTEILEDKCDEIWASLTEEQKAEVLTNSGYTINQGGWGNKIKSMDKSTTTILKKMFRIVKEPYPNNDSYFKTPNWYHDYSVTEKQRGTFKKWMIDFLENDRQARLDLLKMTYKNKKIIEKGVEEWIFCYFWKTKLPYLTIENFHIKAYYEWEQIERGMGKREYNKFVKWMFGQGCYKEGVFETDLKRYMSFNKEIKNRFNNLY